MKILIYRSNEDQEYADNCRTALELLYPEAKIQERNVDYFDNGERESADVVYVRSRFPKVVEAYEAEGVPVVTDTPEAVPEEEPEPDESLFSDEYEQEVMRLLSKTVIQLEDALSRVDDTGMLNLARDRELDTDNGGQGRKSCVKVYNKKIRSLGGIV